MPSWDNVSRAGSPYATAAGERWRFAMFTPRLIATNYTNEVQVFNLDSDTDFSDLAGSPPRARYVDIVRDFVFLGSINGQENRVHWSGLNDCEFWTPGTKSCDFQDAPAGGPVTGVIGGATAYVMQQQRVTRFNYVPGSTAIFQVDEVQGAKGLAAPNSLVRLGDQAWYLSTEGFYWFDIISGGQKPIGVNKWRTFFLNDLRAGTENRVLGAADPVNPIILWAYVSRDNSTVVPDRILAYDRVLDEAAVFNVTVEAMTAWITGDINMETMNGFGTMDTLPYSLDSPAWKQGTSTIGIFRNDHKLSYLQGANLAATVTTADGQAGQRGLINATRPAIDTGSATVAIAMRERDGDTVTFNAAEAMEDTGTVPAWASGNLARAKIYVPAGASWSLLKGIDTMVKPRGKR